MLIENQQSLGQRVQRVANSRRQLNDVRLMQVLAYPIQVQQKHHAVDTADENQKPNERGVQAVPKSQARFVGKHDFQFGRGMGLLRNRRGETSLLVDPLGPRLRMRTGGRDGLAIHGR